MKKSKISRESLFVLLFCLLYVRLFRPLGFTDMIWKVVYYPVLIALFFIVSKAFFKTKFSDVFSSSIRSIFVCVLVSGIVCMGTWGQNILFTLISSIPFFSFIIYFYFLQKNMSLDDMEKVVWWFTAIFLFCFYLALAVAPTRLFIGYGELGKEIDTERGLSRIRLTLIGGGPLFIAYFLAIGKLKESKNGRKWFAVVIFFFITIVLQLGRQAILFSLLLGVLFYMKEMSLFKKVGVIGLISGSALLVPILAPTIIEGLQGRTNQEIEAQQEGEDNVRIAAYKFYFTGVSQNVFNDVFGNGMFTLGKSKYAHFIDYYGRSKGLIPADVGYASIFLYFGALGLLIFLSILWLVLRTGVPPEYEYAKFYVYFLFLGNVAGSTLLGTIPTFCIALYVISLGKRKFRYAKRLAAQNRLIYGSTDGSIAF